jgi:uncharacterized membrane protein YedE/YeeE
VKRNVIALLVGVGFGAVLVAARLNEFDTIHKMLLLRELDVYFLMGSAIATAAPILWWLRRRHWKTLTGEELRVEQSSPTKDTVAGAAVFGAGWAVTGACPGPAIAMTATGALMGVPLMAGLMTGAVLRDMIAGRAGARAARSPEAVASQA